MRLPCAFRRLLLTFSVMTLAPATAHAQGGAIVRDIFYGFIMAFWPLVVIIGVLALVAAGFTLMVSQDEGARDKAIKTLTATIIGGIIATIVSLFGLNPSRFVRLMYSGLPGIFLLPTGGILGLEAFGVAQWISSMAAIIGIVMIIVTVLRAVASVGTDESAYTNVRLVLFHVIIGLTIIGGAVVFQTVFFVTGRPNLLIMLISSRILIVLNFITLIAVAILIYAGLRMVISFGREDEYSAAKSLVFRVIIGLAIILLAYTLVITVANILV